MILEIGTMATSISVAIMVFIMLIFAGMRAPDERTSSWILGSVLQGFQAGLITYIILSPATYEVENESLVTGCIIPATFLMAFFAFEIDLNERKRKGMK